MTLPPKRGYNLSEKAAGLFPTKGDVREASGEFCEIHPKLPCRHAARTGKARTLA